MSRGTTHMPSLRSAVLVAATTLATAAVLAPTTAEAQSWHHRDAGNDVVKVEESGGKEVVTPDPTRTNGDITTVSAYNNPRKVYVVVGLTEVRPGEADASGLGVVVRTSRGVRRDIAIINLTGLTRGYRAVVTDRRGRQVHCDASTIVDSPSRSATVVLPRRCLGRQRWVQVGAGFITGKGETFWADDALLDGRIISDIAFSPRIARDR
jgi:hypothetical protein